MLGYSDAEENTLSGSDELLIVHVSQGHLRWSHWVGEIGGFHWFGLCRRKDTSVEESEYCTCSKSSIFNYYLFWALFRSSIPNFTVQSVTLFSDWSDDISHANIFEFPSCRRHRYRTSRSHPPSPLSSHLHSHSLPRSSSRPVLRLEYL